jgi:hypothetical protein
MAILTQVLGNEWRRDSDSEGNAARDALREEP